MSGIDQLFDQLKAFKRSPIEQWHPDKIVDIDIRIDAGGKWFYQGSEIQRHRIVKLFSTVLRLEGDGQFYLVTPPVKYLIQVEEMPFTVVEFNQQGWGDDQKLHFRTNMDEVVMADADHPIEVTINEQTGEPSPGIMVRDGLKAKITRPVFYQLTELLEPERESISATENGERDWGVRSAGKYFSFGRV